MKSKQDRIRKLTRRFTAIFIILLVLSGLTAFPIESELRILIVLTDNSPYALKNWITTVYESIKQVNNQYPYMAYGTDWLAFGHIVIALFFIGAYRDPVKNIWAYQAGMIACVMVIPLALICGPIRQIPFFWQMIDCSFGVGIIPLYICYRYARQLEALEKENLYL